MFCCYIRAPNIHLNLKYFTKSNELISTHSLRFRTGNCVFFWGWFFSTSKHFCINIFLLMSTRRKTNKYSWNRMNGLWTYPYIFFGIVKSISMGIFSFYSPTQFSHYNHRIFPLNAFVSTHLKYLQNDFKFIFMTHIFYGQGPDIFSASIFSHIAKHSQ